MRMGWGHGGQAYFGPQNWLIHLSLHLVIADLIILVGYCVGKTAWLLNFAWSLSFTFLLFPSLPSPTPAAGMAVRPAASYSTSAPPSPTTFGWRPSAMVN